MKQAPKARIIGHGAYLPSRIFTNKEFESMVETTDEWIVTRTGIKERRIAAPDEFTSDMGAKAAKQALEVAKLSAQEIDLILVATMTPDYISTCTAALIQAQIGAEKAGTLDLQAACSGFVYALATAKAYIESGLYRHVLIVASEKMSTYIDYTDRGTCVLFGDGAAAVVVSDTGVGLVIDNVCLGADGTLADLIQIPAGGVHHPSTVDTVTNRMHCFKMEGKEVFKHAVRRMTVAAKQCLSEIGLTDKDVDWIVPHQANIRIMEAIAKGFDVPEDRMYKTVQKYGNTSASSIPLALEELVRVNPLKAGEHILLVAFGAGLTWGAAVLTQN